MKGESLTIVDCGANIGQWSSSLLTIAKENDWNIGIHLICFEPSEHTYALLASRILNNNPNRVQIELEQIALSSNSGEALLSIVHDGAGVNSLVEVPEKYTKQENVNLITLENYSDNSSIASIDFLKIDAEGHDMDVMLGAKKLLENKRIKVIQFEYNWRWIYSKKFLRDAFDLLLENGYELHKITPLGLKSLQKYEVSLESFVEANYLATLPEYADLFRKVTL